MNNPKYTKKSYTSSINEIVKEINQSKDDTALKDLFDFIDANKQVIEVKEDDKSNRTKKSYTSLCSMFIDA